MNARIDNVKMNIAVLMNHLHIIRMIKYVSVIISMHNVCITYSLYERIVNQSFSSFPMSYYDV